jgi:hypothetical protein
MSFLFPHRRYECDECYAEQQGADQEVRTKYVQQVRGDHCSMTSRCIRSTILVSRRLSILISAASNVMSTRP